MRIQRLSIFILAALLVLGTAGLGYAALSPDPLPFMDPDPEMQARSESYRAGQQALDDERWSEAARHFESAAAEGGGSGDGALYWQAYALLKMNRTAHALAVVDELKGTYPQSTWVDDAMALEVEAGRIDVDVEIDTGDSTALEDEELKLLALNTLVHVDWERARPILEKYLREGTSEKLTERALFIASQSDDPEARQMLLDAARDPDRPELAAEAIHFLGFYEDTEASAVLREIYDANPNAEVRETVIEAWGIAGDQQSIADVARNEPDPELRKTAIEQLGILDALPLLEELYAQESDVEVKEDILEAFMIADDKETLLAVARTESNEELRETAIEQLGILDALPELRELYGTEPSPRLRATIAEAFMIADDAEMLIQIAGSDAEPEVREAAIEGLALIETPEADQALARIYDTSSEIEVKEWLIGAFMLREDSAKLIEIIRTEKNPELREEALEALAYIDSEEATEYMLKILEEG
jgi:HEAT repeat protein